MARIRRGWRSDQLRNQAYEHVSPTRHLRWKDPQGRQAGRSAGPAADDIRAGGQSQDRQRARPHRPAIDPRPRRRGDRMNRRELLLLGGAAIAGCRSARAQRRALPLVAFLSPRTFAANINAFRRGLRELGYVEGQNIALEVRSAEGDNRRLPALAAELVSLKPDVM